MASLRVLAFSALIGAGTCTRLHHAEIRQAGVVSARTAVYFSKAPYGLDRIDQREALLDGKYIHNNTGRGVTVYVFDGGILTSHPEVFPRVVRRIQAVKDSVTPCNAHGTAVASAIAGQTLGAAPEATIVDVVIFGCPHSSRPIIKHAADLVVADHKLYPGPAVANWSISIDSNAVVDSLVTSAIDELIGAGITVVVSATNLNKDACDTYPPSDPRVVSVGSITSVGGNGGIRDTLSTGSSWGDCVTIYAPGDDVHLAGFDSQYAPTERVWGGTSFATGYVSGAAALYLEDHPKADPEEVKRYLIARATKNVVMGTRSKENRLLYVGIDSVARR